MKKLFFALLGLIVLAGCGGNSSSDDKTVSDSVVQAPVIDTTKTYIDVIMKVEGMTCTGCENTVVKALRATPGVADAAASWDAGIVKAKFDPALANNDAVKAAVEAKGYKVTSVEVQ